MVAITMNDAAGEIRRYLESDEIGGLVSIMDLAREWGISRTRAHQLAARPDFPAPIAEVAAGTARMVKLYSRTQAQQWRDTPRGPGTPKGDA